MDVSILEEGPWASLYLSYDKYSKTSGELQWSFLRVKKVTFRAMFMLKTPIFPGAMRFLTLFRKTKFSEDAEQYFWGPTHDFDAGQVLADKAKGRDIPGLSAVHARDFPQGQQGAFPMYFLLEHILFQIFAVSHA